MDSRHRCRLSRQPSVLSPLNGVGSVSSPVKGRRGSNVFRATPSISHEVQTEKLSRRRTINVPSPGKSGDETYVDQSPAPQRTVATRERSRASVDVRMSGSTFVHIESDHEDHQGQPLDANLMLSALPDLVSASDRTLNTLAPSDFTTQKLQKAFKNPKFLQILSRLEATFETQKKEFGPAHFINTEAATRALLSGDGANRKLDLIWRKANLARLSLDIMLWLLGSDDLMAQLSRLDECFPSPFVDSSSRDHEPFITPSMFLAGLEIRTQFCLATLREEQYNDSGKSPNDVLEDIFTWPTLGAADELRGWSVDALQVDMGQLPQTYMEIVTQRMDEIRKAFSTSDDQVDFEKLNSRFPRLEYAALLARWIRREVNDVNAELTNQERLDATISRLTEELDRHPNISNHDNEPEFSGHLEKQNEYTESTLVQEAEEEQNPNLGQASPQRRDLDLTPLAQRIGRKFRASFSSQDPAGDEDQFNEEGYQHEQRSEQAEVRHRSFNRRILGRYIRKRYRKSLSAQDAVAKESQVDEQDHEQERETEKLEGQEQGRDQDEASHVDAAENAAVGSPELGDPDSNDQASTIRVPYILQFLEKPKALERKAKGSSSVSGSVSDRQSAASERVTTKSPTSRRNFIDRQRGASRVSPITGTSGITTGTSGIRPRKRGASEIDDDYESSAFEEDRREVDVVRNRERASKRVRTEVNDDDDYQPSIIDEDDQNRSDEDESRNRTIVTTTGSLSESHGEAIIRGGDIFSQGVRIQADRDVETPLPLDRPQRKPWTPREERRLIKLIEKYSTSWAAIQKADAKHPSPMLQSRNQIDLKDKARNLAFKCYREREPLPLNFERIKLTNKHKESLRRAGIAYEPYESSQRDTS